MVRVLRDSSASVSSLMLAEVEEKVDEVEEEEEEVAVVCIVLEVTTEGPLAGMVMMVRWRGTGEVERVGGCWDLGVEGGVAGVDWGKEWRDLGEEEGEGGEEHVVNNESERMEVKSYKEDGEDFKVVDDDKDDDDVDVEEDDDGEVLEVRDDVKVHDGEQQEEAGADVGVTEDPVAEASVADD